MSDNLILQTLANNDFRKDVLCKALLLKGGGQKELFKLARQKRAEYFPSKRVEARSVVEISNICQRKCRFCNINYYSKNLKRYIIKHSNLIKTVEYVYRKKRRVILFQSGENQSQNYIDFICEFLGEIKQRFGNLVIILCLGNLAYKQYKQLKEAGADRYILKFETSNPVLYKQIKPDDSLKKRIKCLEMLIKLGFDVGSGNIIGLPDQTLEDVVNDLLFLHHFKLVMMSTSIFIPGEDAEYRDKPSGDLNIALNFMALMRLLYPKMLIPSTSSLEKAKIGGQYLGLMAGANTVTVHDGTPLEFKKHFPIYSTSRFTPDEKHIINIVAKARLSFE